MISIKRRSVGDIIANVVIYILLTLIAVIMVIPFIYVIAASFATEAEIQTRPIFFIPDSPTLDAIFISSLFFEYLSFLFMQALIMPART